MTLLCTVLSIFQIVDVKSPASFTIKVVGFVVGINLIGTWHSPRANALRRQDCAGTLGRRMDLKVPGGCMLRMHFQALVGACMIAEAFVAQTPAQVDCGRDIQPIFRDYCITCHGPSQQVAGPRLDRREDATIVCARRVILPSDSAAHIGVAL